MFVTDSVLLLILGITIAILITNKRLSSPTRLEMKFLLFGFLSNIVIFFYAFQNALNIEEFVTIYFTMILVLLLYMLMVDRKKINYEILIDNITTEYAFKTLDDTDYIYEDICSHLKASDNGWSTTCQYKIKGKNGSSALQLDTYVIRNGVVVK